ncbi:interleukin 19 like [Xyrauchen texanus]|uniref:interleukin 19 like n=1 Tax=Xyrauchen texanus TaxID=154827 RepID=UPI0022426509|nr:interleukin 19 like [Xyrauchen texanus]XP_051958043.1 interleukin 19 like [Xyrauchen texanus]
MMKNSLILYSLLLCTLLGCLWGTAQGRKLHLGKCVVNIHTHELRHHFQHIRQGMIAGDNNKVIRLLGKEVMKSLQGTESCCFLRQLLHFYMDKVFINYTSSHSLHRRTTSVLANSFLGITKDLHVCHANANCECSEGATQKIADIKTMYNKLDQTAGTVKAIGELDSLFEWLESFQHH